MVLTSSYGAWVEVILPAFIRTVPLPRSSNATPMPSRSLAIVRTSASSGTLCSTTSSAVKSAAAMIGNAAFLAPDAFTCPTRRRPPTILSFCISPYPFLIITPANAPGSRKLTSEFLILPQWSCLIPRCQRLFLAQIQHFNALCAKRHSSSS